MSDVQTIYAGEGAQAVEVYATDDLGRFVKPASATARIVDLEYSEDADDSDRIILATSAATVDTTSTATTAAAGPRTADPRKIVVTSATGITVGRMYALSGGGRVEALTVDRVDGLNVYAVHQLREAFAIEALFIGLRVSATFPETVADDGDELERRALFGVDWVFTFPSGTNGPKVRRTLARIERRGPAPLVSASELLDIDPQLAVALHSRSTLESHIRQATREVRAKLLHANNSLADTSFGDVAKLATAWRAVELAYQALGTDHEGRADRARTEAQAWDKLLLGGRRADDAVDTTRDTDKRRGTRSRFSVGAMP